MPVDRYLADCLEKNLIKPEKIAFRQIDKVIAAAAKDIIVAEKLLAIDEGHAYETAYTAMLHAGRAFMFSKGYRPTPHFQHKTVVDFTQHYLDEKYKTLVESFDHMRKARNNLIYEPWKVNITLTDAESALKSARDFITIIKNTIREQNPQEHFKFL